jgi:predicted small secreted protein
MMKKQKQQIWAMLCCLMLTSCATYQRSDLYFGRDIPDGGQVSEQQWKTFSDSVISHYFPEGYTEWNAEGRWKDTQTKKTITEPTKVVTFFGKSGKQRDAALDSIAQQYLRRFRQQSVLRTDSKSSVRFISTNK